MDSADMKIIGQHIPLGDNASIQDRLIEYWQLCNKAEEIWATRIPGDLHSHFEALTAFYKLIEDQPWCPCPCDIEIPMTPIEEAAWMDIRSLGLHFYKQFPVGKYFVDFGDPVRKVAVECDGKAFHDTDKDSVRDVELYEMGWHTIRFTGCECFLPYEHPDSPYQVLKREYRK